MAGEHYYIILADEGGVPASRVLEALEKAGLTFTARLVNWPEPWAVVRAWQQGPPADAIIVIERYSPAASVSGFVQVASRLLASVPLIVVGPAFGGRRRDYAAYGALACLTSGQLGRLGATVRETVRAARREGRTAPPADAQSLAVLQAAAEAKSALYALSERVLIKDAQLRFSYATEFWARDFGMTSAEAVGKTDCDVFGPERGARFQEEDRRVLGAGRTLRVTDPDTGEFMDKVPILDQEGRSIALVLVAGRTLDARRRLEDRLCELAELVAGSGDAIIGLAFDGTVLSWNPGATQVYGYTAEQMVGRPVADLASPKAAARLHDSITAAVTTHAMRKYHATHRRRDNSPVDVAVTVSPIIGPWGETMGASLFSHDISAQKRAERALRESEKRFRLMAETAFDGMSIAEQSSAAAPRRLVWCNERFVAMSGRTADELRQAPDLDQLRRMGPDAAAPEVLGMLRAEYAQPSYWEQCRQRLDGGLPVLEIGSWDRPDGAENYHERSCVAVHTGKRIMTFAVDRDVTATLRRERELREVLSRLALSHAELNRFVPSASPAEPPGLHEQAIESIANEVRRDPLQDYDFRAAAERLHMSYGYFRRLFRSYIGRPPRDYLLLWRMRRAAGLLGGSARAVKSVAYQIGYDDPAHFCKLFRAKLGMPPTAYCRAVARPEALGIPEPAGVS